MKEGINSALEAILRRLSTALIYRSAEEIAEMAIRSLGDGYSRSSFDESRELLRR